MQMQNDKPEIKMPDLDWKVGECEVCGKPFKFLGKRKPHTCRDGECRYKFDYKISPENWASHQPDLFTVDRE